MASTTYNPYAKEERKGQEHTDKAKDAGKEALAKAKEAGKEAIDATKQAGSDALEKAKDVGADVMNRAKDAAASVGEMATSAASTVGQKADDMTSAAGHEIREFGNTIAQKGPHGGFAGAASQAVADTIKGGGRYLEDAKLSGMAQDMEQVVKNHPIPAMLICLGIGFCVGRLIKD